MAPETRSQKRKRDLLLSNSNDKNSQEPSEKRIKIVIKKKIENYQKWSSMDSKPKVNVNDPNKPDYFKWVSGSSIKNHLLRDALVDWLELYYSNNNSNNNTNKIESTNILFTKGNEFERLVFDSLDKKFKNKTTIICKDRADFFNRNLVKKTLDAMKLNIPIIKQAMVVNEDNYTCGVADLLVRCDYLDKLFCNPVNYSYSSKKLHYVVIDIKWSVINLCADGIHILNSDRSPAYKGQIALYNLALGKLQGYIPDKAFILGKSWKWNSKSLSGYNCFDRCGTIDFNGFDKQYIQMTRDAIDWMHEVRFCGHDWDCLKPHKSEMYPNMSNSNSNPKWNTIKQELADKLNEITKIWMVSSHHREYAHSQKIFKWTDSNCCSTNLNINGKIIAPVVNKFIEMNRDTNKKLITSFDPISALKKSANTPEFYIDFETINDIFMKDSINIENSHCYSDVCFRISVGYESKKEYKSVAFKMKHYSLEEEKRIFCEFRDFIETFRKKNKNPRLIHWAVAEQTFMNHANERHGGFLTEWLKRIELVDLCKIFVKTPIIVKGMFKFKLKEVAGAMYKNGMIQTKWEEDSEIHDGMSAMMSAIDYYKDPKNTNNKKIMKKIEKYNDIDTRVLWEIVNYLRL